MLRYLAVPLALALVLFAQPSTQQSSQTIQKNVGETVVFQAYNSPGNNLQGQWYFDNSPIALVANRGTIYESGQVRYMVLYAASVQDSGTYRYQAGADSATFILTVIGTAVVVCEVNNGNCGQYGTCSYDTLGRVVCSCINGYQRVNNDCVLINQCLGTNNGGCDLNARCIFSTTTGVSCECNQGYQGDGYSCTQVQINPCLGVNNGGCSAFARCSYSTATGVSCFCNQGYQGDGYTCNPIQINPCLGVNNGGCSAFARCSYSTVAGVSCFCNQGYQGDGYTCNPIVVERDLCTQAQLYQGVGYLNHPTDCDRYLQCYTSPSGMRKGVFRKCPFGFFWEQSTLSCKESWKVDCPTARCDGKCEPHYKMSGSCRAYWKCNKGAAEGQCCMAGMMYEEGFGCRPNFFCRDPCPTACVDKDPCAKRPSYDGDISAYNISVGILGWVPSRCISGSYFEISECGCKSLDTICRPLFNVAFASIDEFTLRRNQYVTTFAGIPINNGLAYFYANSTFLSNIKRTDPSPFKPVVIRFSYTETNSIFGRRVLLSSSNCEKKDALVVAVNNANITFELRSYYDNIVTLALPTRGFSRYQKTTVTIRYDGHVLSASISQGSFKYYDREFAPDSNFLECGMRFGRDMYEYTPGFVGTLESLIVYNCDPGNYL